MNIAFVGSHSTGKTTLLKYIEKRHDVSSIKYVVKDVIQQGFPMGKDANCHSWVRYITEQLREERTLFSDTNGVIISDRCILDALAYAKTNKNIPRPYIPNYFIEMLYEVWRAEDKYFDIYVFFPVEFEMETASKRPDDEEYRKSVGKTIKRLLESSNADFISVTGSVEERYNKLINNIGDI